MIRCRKVVEAVVEATTTALHLDRVELPVVEVRVEDGRTFSLEVAPLVVGTHPDCDVVLVDPRASRRHCRLSLGDRGVLVEDLGSKNGTLASGVVLERGQVAMNVPLIVGDTRLTVSPLGGTVEVPLSRERRFGDAIGASLPMRALFARLERAATTEVTVLLLGESGSGKELFARGIHAASARRDGPFVPFDCGAVPPALIEAELFGYVRGAFTGAAADHPGVLAEADGGTLFLDEIGELPLDLQPKLLRALEARQYRPVGGRGYRSFDARIVAATNRPLRHAMATGTFREDLYYRLAVVEARIPALRERRDDIELLIDSFLAAQAPPRSIRDLPAGTLAIMQGHHWPGNVRELKNAVSRLLLFPESAVASFDLEPGAATGTGSGGELFLHLPLRQAREQVVESFERAYIVAKLTESGGNVSRAAAQMGLSRQFLHRLMERYDVRRMDVR